MIAEKRKLNTESSREINCTAGILPTTVERYIYDGQQVVADVDSSDNLLSMTIYTNGGSQASATYYAIKDHQNTVIAFVDSSGTIVESYEYDAWGNVQIFSSTGQSITSSTIGNRYLFQGREYDSTTGLYYFRARWYDPVAGRFISKDPIGISGGLNLYAAFENNPMSFVDPAGLDSLYIYGDDGLVGAYEERAAANYDGSYKADSWENAANYVENYANHIGSVTSVTVGGHGADGGGFQYLGSDILQTSGLVGQDLPIERIGNSMSSGGAIHLKGCYVGLDPTFVQTVANLSGQRISAFTTALSINPFTGNYFSWKITERVSKCPE